jgi:hypothetical protein
MPSFDAPAAFSDDELLSLLRDESVSCASIVCEMEDAGAQPHTAEALTAAREILKSFGAESAAAIETLPPALRTLFLDMALAQRQLDLLAKLVQSRDKAVVKDAKRAIHTLKSQGLKVEAPKPAPAAAPAPVAAEEPAPVFMTAIDGLGQRVLFFTAVARGGMDVAQIVVSEETGVVSADFAPLGRKEYRKFLDRLQSAVETLVAEVPRPYARWLVARALDLNARARRAVPPSYNDAALILGPTVGMQMSPGRALPAPDEQAILVARGGELLGVKDLRSWGPPDAQWTAFETKVADIFRSQLYIDETQKLGAIRELVSSSVASFWTRAQRDVFAERLFDMAWLFGRTRKDTESALAVASARALLEDRPIESVPFAYAFFERLVKKPESAAGQTPAPHLPRERSAEPSNLIIPG